MKDEGYLAKEIDLAIKNYMKKRLSGHKKLCPWYWYLDFDVEILVTKKYSTVMCWSQSETACLDQLGWKV